MIYIKEFDFQSWGSQVVRKNGSEIALVVLNGLLHDSLFGSVFNLKVADGKYNVDCSDESETGSGR